MKITIYELLGLVKDGKAPEEVRYDDTIYEYSEVNDFYYCNGFSLYRDFVTNGNCLNNEVEIIEKSKKIEKIECSVESWFTPSQADIEIIKKLNELIDEINNLKEK